MAEKEKDKFYSNREIYEMLMAEKDERLKLSEELKLTRQYIQKYNGLREEIYKQGLRINELEGKQISNQSQKSGQLAVGDAIIKWSGWVGMLITLGVLLAQLF